MSALANKASMHLLPGEKQKGDQTGAGGCRGGLGTLEIRWGWEESTLVVSQKVKGIASRKTCGYEKGLPAGLETFFEIPTS